MERVRWTSRLGAIVLGLGLGVTAWAGHAAACGGTFCDQPTPTPQDPDPPPMTVNQTAETVLFEVRDGQVEAHVRIEYDPTSQAEQFAWLIPVPALPEFEVGSEPLFDLLVSRTQPTYDLEVTVDDDCPCNPPVDQGGGDGGGPVFLDAGVGGGGGEPEVVLEAQVGAFEATVLAGGTVQGVMTWLDDNGYDQDPAAMPILQDYLDEGHLFVALKLTNDADVAQIHPVVIRFPGSEPCVPLRLTRIAAEPDMAVRVIGLGEARLAPTNWSYVELNPWAIDWTDVNASYPDVMVRAIDEAPGGLAWVTEYAGSTPGLAPGTLAGPGWDETPFVTIEPVSVIDELNAQGLTDCETWSCGFRHPLVGGLLAAYLPVPAGVSAEEFYGDLAAWEDDIDLVAWDGEQFAADYRERIIDPALRAEELMWENPYTTRLTTLISPHEMVSDPMFHENATLLDVDNRRQLDAFEACNEWRTLSLEGWPDVHLRPDWTWHSLDLPPALRVERMPPAGPPMIDTDFSTDILAELEAWESSLNWPGSGTCEAPEEPGPIEGNDAGTTDFSARTSCACRTTRDATDPRGPALALVFVGGLFTYRRRRARR